MERKERVNGLLRPMTAQEKLLDSCHDLTGDVTRRGGRIFVPLND